MSTSLRRPALLLVAIVATGCGPQPRFVEVAGRVLSDGEPLDEVVLTFMPTAAEFERYTSSAVTDSQGAFRLRCVDGQYGAVVGRHRVTIEDLRPYRAPRNNEPPVAPERFASRVGPSYKSVSQTPLLLDVEPGHDALTLEIGP